MNQQDKSREAFELALLKLMPEGVTANAYRLLKPTEYMLAHQFFDSGRKAALEDVIKCVNSERGSSTDNLILKIKEFSK